MNAGRITGELAIDECDERRLGLPDGGPAGGRMTPLPRWVELGVLPLWNLLLALLVAGLVVVIGHSPCRL